MVFTTRNRVAPAMEVPPSAVGTLTPNKPSPLAVSIRNAEHFEVNFDEMRAIVAFLGRLGTRGCCLINMLGIVWRALGVCL